MTNENDNLEYAFKTICDLFFIKSLKDYQKEALIALSNGIDCFVCKPTGCEKN